MTYCSLDEAFQDPFVKRVKKTKRHKKTNKYNNSTNTNNNNIVEGFGCLNGSNQMDISNEYRMKGDLSRRRQNPLTVDIQLDKNQETRVRSDESSFLPDMSLESEYALITDIDQKKNQGYRPPHPMTYRPEVQPIDENDNYEPFNQNDMTLMEHDAIQEVIQHPPTLNYNVNNNPNNGHNNPNQPEVPESESENDWQTSYQNLEAKLDLVLDKLSQMEEQKNNEKPRENFNDIILFAIFGIFFIYILDSVYRVGRKSK